MTSALEIASLFGVLELRDNATGALRGFDNLLSNTGQRLQALGGGMQQLGAGITAVAAPAVATLAIAGNAALDFGSSMADVGAVLGRNQEEMAALGDEILAFSANTRAGPQAVIEAFYDIAGSVLDVNSHMAILEAATRTAEAGNAEFSVTTSALTSVMNSYRFSTEQAAFASDVLTRTVQMGVGSMDEFGAAFPAVTGLAASLGIEFENLAAAGAFLTLQGNSPAQAFTQLSGMMSALINPSERMRDALTELGFASGYAAVEQLGLVGTYEALIDEFGKENLAPLIGQMEAVRGVVALTEGDFENFSNSFIEAIDGATEAALAIQMEAPAAQLDLLRSQMAVLSIEVGSALIPVMLDFVKAVRPVVSSVIDWVKNNPGLVRQIGLFTGGAAVAGTVLIGLGTAISSVGTIVTGLGGAISFLLSPIGLAIAAGAALAYAYETNFLGIRDVLEPFVTNVINGIDAIIRSIGFFVSAVQQFGLEEAILGIFGEGSFGETVQSTLEGVLVAFGMSRDEAIDVVASIYSVLQGMTDFVTSTLLPAVQSFFIWLGQSWAVVAPALGNLYNWFVGEAMPQIVSILQNSVYPLMQSVFGYVAQIWEIVRPALEQFGLWFLSDGLPAIQEFITNVALPVIQGFIEIVRGFWEMVSPALLALADWFVNTGLPVVMYFIENSVMPVIEMWQGILQNLWTIVQPGLQAMYNWFKEAMKAIANFIQPVIDKLTDLQELMSGLDAWGGVGDNANVIGGGLSSGAWNVGDVFNAAVGAIGAEFRDTGGPGSAGEAYMIGSGAQPEMFIPNTDGYFIPNADRMMGGGVQVGSVVIYANSRAEGAAAADGFMQRMDELRRRRG